MCLLSLEIKLACFTDSQNLVGNWMCVIFLDIAQQNIPQRVALDHFSTG